MGGVGDLVALEELVCRRRQAKPSGDVALRREHAEEQECGSDARDEDEGQSQ